MVFRQAESRVLKSSAGFNFIRFQTSVIYVSCGLLWMEADPATMRNGMRRTDHLMLRKEEISTVTNLLGNVSQMLAWALPASSEHSVSDSGAGAQLRLSQALGLVPGGLG